MFTEKTDQLRGDNVYDFVIIGSGFGGSVSALRLTEKGYKVLVIEKGKRFSPDDFPKTNWNLRRWLWLPALGFYGIQKLTFLRHASIMSGTGVGGGSLVYANTLPKPKPAFYSKGSWAGLADWETELAPYYDLSLQMLGAEVNPKLFDNDLTFQKLAAELGKPEAFSPTNVAVYFGEAEKVTADPYFAGRGPERSGCRHCGACMTGCRYNAKNTLDKNYLYLAEKLGARVLPERKVMSVVPVNSDGSGGYQIIYKSSTKNMAGKHVVRTKGVIFAGGVMGTVPLLLKLKNTTLTHLSPMMGQMVRTNSEALIHNTTVDPKLEMHKGVAIGSIIEYDENSHIEPVRYSEGSGFWRLTMLPLVSDKKLIMRIIRLAANFFRSPWRWLKIFFVKDFAKSSSILLFMQHLDSTIRFKKSVFGIRSLADSGIAPTPFIPEAHQAAKRIAGIINGESLLMVNEILANIPSTAHILGGACMGKNASEGVIDSQNRVFGYQNMYIFDGSMISANPGVNPSLSITAITERGMSLIPAKS